jgi:pectinesterase
MGAGRLRISLVAAAGLVITQMAAPAGSAQGAASDHPDAVVAADGSGQYKTVQEAIAAAPQTTSAAHRWIIFIKAGTYRELVYVQREKRFVALVGEDPARTILTWHLKATDPASDGTPIGTFRTASTIIDADDFSAENLTFQNDSGPVGQALAVRVDGDRVVFRNCRFIGWQDTVLLNRGRQYIEDSLIAGHVDFIFGGATAFFERCRLHAWSNGYLTAASTPQDAPYGFVFAHGRITGAGDAHTYLGRPWRDYAHVTFLDTEMTDVVRPEGWHNWDKPEREHTARFEEFHTTGIGAAAAHRVAWAKTLTSTDVAAITPARVLAGSDQWNPQQVPAHPSKTSALAGPLPPAPGAPMTWDEAQKQPVAWFAGADADRIATDVVRYQRATGGWPKNTDMARTLSPAEADLLARDRALTDSTIDNGATTTQVRFLARVDAAHATDRHRASIDAGLDYLLAAQYPNGGWPQFFPLRADYSRHITFNDDAMTNVMQVLRDVSTGRAPFEFVDQARRARAADAIGKGLEIILKTQIVGHGRPTGWCQQYDEQSLQPAAARTYEHPSNASKETVAIVRYLMGLEKPDARVVAAVDNAVTWLRAVAIHGVRVERRPDASGPTGVDVVVVPDPAGPPVWARFYAIGTDTPIYSGRDGVIKSSLADIEIERRAGYSWVGPYASALVDTEYAAWKARVGRLPGLAAR